MKLSTLTLAALLITAASLSAAAGAFYGGGEPELVRHANGTGETSAAAHAAFTGDPCDPTLSCCYLIDPDPLGGVGSDQWDGPGWYGIC